MNARNRIFIMLGVLFLFSLCWYFFTAHRSEDLQLIGTVDANEVIISSRIPGRIQTLTVDEGDDVRAGQLIATIQSDDLEAARQAAEATAASQRYQAAGSERNRASERRWHLKPGNECGSPTASAQAALVQAQAQYEHQNADTSRTVALAAQGIMSYQSRDEAATALHAAQAAVDSARANVAAAQASLKVAIGQYHSSPGAPPRRWSQRAAICRMREPCWIRRRFNWGMRASLSPISGKVNVRAARQGEVVAAGTPIVTITDLTQTWVYAPLPETEADSVQLGDSLRVVMPSGATIQGKVIAKSAEADFATQRDVSRRKRDIKTIRLKLLIDNPGMRYVPGMLAEVYIPKDKLVTR